MTSFFPEPSEKCQIKRYEMEEGDFFLLHSTIFSWTFSRTTCPHIALSCDAMVMLKGDFMIFFKNTNGSNRKLVYISV